MSTKTLIAVIAVANILPVWYSLHYVFQTSADVTVSQFIAGLFIVVISFVLGVMHGDIK